MGHYADTARQSSPGRTRLDAAGVLACVAGLIALAGTAYALSYHDDERSELVWAIFAGYALGGLGVLAAGVLALRGRHQRLATDLLMVSGLTLLLLAGFTVMGVGWLVLPGAVLAQVAIFLRLRSGDGR